MTTLSLADKKPTDLPVDALVLGVVAGPDGPALADGHSLPAAAARHLGSALRSLGATGKPDEVIKVAAVPKVKAPVVVLTGLGKQDAGSGVDDETLRRAAGAALRAIGRGSAGTVGLALPAASAGAVGAVAEGAYAGRYAFQPRPAASAAKQKGRKPAPGTPTGGGAGAGGRPGAPAPDVVVLTPVAKESAAKRALARAQILGAAQDYVRDLVNTPANRLFPQSFADSVKDRVAATAAKVSIEVMDERALAEAGCGGIVGVGQGSARPPRIVTLSWKPRRSGRSTPSVALVGKGITFDSGGLCLKPAASMLTMKCDMAGAAAVAATVIAAAELDLPVAVTGYLCLAENMPSGTAQRPGDVVTMRNGTTVEIIDTDAEGRMVLGDGLCLASEQQPDAIVDIATLTGAQVVALGAQVCGVMGNQEGFRAEVVESATEGGEAAWPMPLPADLRPKLESQVADLAHKGDRWGGMLTAGLFLQEFVGRDEGGDQIPWAHVDIAGPAFNDGSAHGHTPKGGTGFGVATLLRVIERHARR